jgi:Tol biopolymer transport system component
VVVRGNGSTAVLASGLPNALLDLAPSPQGSFVALGAGLAGAWIINRDGSDPHRVLDAPFSHSGNHLGVQAVAWSPDRLTLAYAISPMGTQATRPDRLAGIWLATYAGFKQRLLVTSAQLGAVDAKGVSLGFQRLSWSSDGRTLAVSTQRPALRGETPVVLGVDVATGRVRVLATGAGDATFAPSTTALAYLSYGDLSDPSGALTTLRVAAVAGEPGRAIVSTHNFVQDLVWAPDGRTLAYIWDAHQLQKSYAGGSEIHQIDPANGRVQVLRRGAPPGLSGAHFLNLAWLHALS